MENEELRNYRFNIVTKMEEFCMYLKADIQLMNIVLYADEHGFDFKRISNVKLHIQDVIERMVKRIKEFEDENVQLK
jgi:hypothetical protein